MFKKERGKQSASGGHQGLLLTALLVLVFPVDENSSTKCPSLVKNSLNFISPSNTLLFLISQIECWQQTLIRTSIPPSFRRMSQTRSLGLRPFKDSSLRLHLLAKDQKTLQSLKGFRTYSVSCPHNPKKPSPPPILLLMMKLRGCTSEAILQRNNLSLSCKFDLQINPQTSSST